MTNVKNYYKVVVNQLGENIVDLYILTTYEYDTYSYSGVSEREHHVHATEGGALAHAKELGLTVAEYSESDRVATIDKDKLLD